MSDKSLDDLFLSGRRGFARPNSDHENSKTGPSSLFVERKGTEGSNETNKAAEKSSSNHGQVAEESKLPPERHPQLESVGMSEVAETGNEPREESADLNEPRMDGKTRLSENGPIGNSFLQFQTPEKLEETTPADNHNSSSTSSPNDPRKSQRVSQPVEDPVPPKDAREIIRDENVIDTVIPKDSGYGNAAAGSPKGSEKSQGSSSQYRKTWTIEPLKLEDSSRVEPVVTETLAKIDKKHKIIASYQKKRSASGKYQTLDSFPHKDEASLHDRLFESESMNEQLKLRLKKASIALDKLHDEKERYANFGSEKQQQGKGENLAASLNVDLVNFVPQFMPLMEHQMSIFEPNSSMFPMPLMTGNQVSIELLSAELQHIKNRLSSLEHFSCPLPAPNLEAFGENGHDTETMHSEINTDRSDCLTERKIENTETELSPTIKNKDRYEEIQKELSGLYQRMTDLEYDINKKSLSARNNSEGWSSRPESVRKVDMTRVSATESGRVPPLKIRTQQKHSVPKHADKDVSLSSLKADYEIYKSKNMPTNHKIKGTTMPTRAPSSSTDDLYDYQSTKIEPMEMNKLKDEPSMDYKPLKVMDRTPFVPQRPQDVRTGYELKFIKTDGTIEQGRVMYMGSLPGRTELYYGIELLSRGTFQNNESIIKMF